MWEELYKTHYRELVAYGIHMTFSKELSEDLAQETFIKALINCEVLEGLTAGKQRAWLYRTFKNLLFDRYRRKNMENEYIQSLRYQDETEGQFDEVESDMLLQSVSLDERLLFCLRYIEGYTAAEISEMLKIPPGTIRSKLSRCRKKLKANIDF